VVTLVPSTGRPIQIPITVNPDDRTVVPETVPGGAPWIGAVVDLQGGAASVEQSVASSLGQSTTPCATTGSTNWYFATGATLVNASTVISLLNPYPTNAIVDLSFVTDQGVESPSDFQGLLVPAGGLTAVDLGTHLRRRQAIATTVAVRTGRVVAWKTDVVTPPAPGAVLLGSPQASSGSSAAPVDPAAQVPGVTVTLGAPSLRTTWAWPDGVAGEGVDERYVIYNPGPGTAEVRLSLNLDQGSAEPFTLSVGPDQVTTVTSAQQARIPAGVAHSAVLETTNGVPVMAERVVAAAAPSNRRGLGELVGAAVAAPRWLLAAGSASATQDEWVVLFNAGSSAVQFTLYQLTGGGRRPVRGVTGVNLGSGQRFAVRVADRVGRVGSAFVVDASGPVYAERDLYGSATSPGVSLSFGVPLTP
jgi:hypothetical protein